VRRVVVSELDDRCPRTGTVVDGRWSSLSIATAERWFDRAEMSPRFA
jgi:hypothetical protein